MCVITHLQTHIVLNASTYKYTHLQKKTPRVYVYVDR